MFCVDLVRLSIPVQVKKERLSEMTCNVLMGTLNPSTHTHSRLMSHAIYLFMSFYVIICLFAFILMLMSL